VNWIMISNMLQHRHHCISACSSSQRPLETTPAHHSHAGHHKVTV